VNNLQWIGAGVLTIIKLCMVFWNRQRIAKEEKMNK
jgi:hypothetical protein